MDSRYRLLQLELGTKDGNTQSFQRDSEYVGMEHGQSVQQDSFHWGSLLDIPL